MNGKPMTVVATSLKLRGWRQLRRFFKLNGAIKRQLNVSSGLVQYRLKADFLRLRFSTLSVWVNGQAVDDFTNTGAHREAIASFDSISDRKVSGFLRWEVAELEAVHLAGGVEAVDGANTNSGQALNQVPLLLPALVN